MADNDEQWLERALTREKESLEAGSGVMGELFKQYEQAAREIRISVNDFLVRYEDEQGSAYDRAAKSLNASEMQEWKDSVNDWAQRVDEEKDDAAKQLLQSRLKSVKCSDPPLTRLDLASRQMRIALYDLSAKNVRQMRNALESLYSEAYYKKIFDIEQRYGLLREFKKSEAKLDDVLSHPWSGLNFMDRMAENINMLHFQMRETIVHGLIHGKSSIEILKDLSDQTGVSYKQLERLVQTESAYFHSEAIRMAYEAAGVKQYEYVAKLDRSTSDTCISLDGKKFNVSDAKRGTNYPPMHPRCRSTTIEIADGMDESRLVDEPLPKDMTYEQWYMERLEGTGEDADSVDLDNNLTSNERLLAFISENEGKYRGNLNYDCSEIADDLLHAAGGKGEILTIRSSDKFGQIEVVEYGSKIEFDYHTIYSDGIYVYDPRYSDQPIPKNKYLEDIKQANSDAVVITMEIFE